MDVTQNVMWTRMGPREVKIIRFSVSPFGPFLAMWTRRKGNPMIRQAFSVYLRRIFGLPMKEYFYIMLDDFVKSPTSVLRCILRHYDVLSVRLIPQDLRALNLELFTLPSSLDFLRGHHIYY
jgi:hypothetical protein